MGSNGTRSARAALPRLPQFLRNLRRLLIGGIFFPECPLVVFTLARVGFEFFHRAVKRLRIPEEADDAMLSIKITSPVVRLIARVRFRLFRRRMESLRVLGVRIARSIAMGDNPDDTRQRIRALAAIRCVVFIAVAYGVVSSQFSPEPSRSLIVSSRPQFSAWLGPPFSRYGWPAIWCHQVPKVLFRTNYQVDQVSLIYSACVCGALLLATLYVIRRMRMSYRLSTLLCVVAAGWMALTLRRVLGPSLEWHIEAGLYLGVFNAIAAPLDIVRRSIARCGQLSQAKGTGNNKAVGHL